MVTSARRLPVDHPRLAGALLAAAILGAVVWATAEGYGELPDLPSTAYVGGAP